MDPTVIMLSLVYLINLTGLPFNQVFIHSIQVLFVQSVSSQTIKNGTWQHLAYSLFKSKCILFTLMVQLTGNEMSNIPPSSIMRSANYLVEVTGRLTSYGDQDTDADLDEIKIFSKGLSQQEILFEMNNDAYSNPSITTSNYFNIQQ